MREERFELSFLLCSESAPKADVAAVSPFPHMRVVYRHTQDLLEVHHGGAASEIRTRNPFLAVDFLTTPCRHDRICVVVWSTP